MFLERTKKKGGRSMRFMYATKKNYRIVNKIIELLHEEHVYIQQADAILEYTKGKIASDTEV